MTEGFREFKKIPFHIFEIFGKKFNNLVFRISTCVLVPRQESHMIKSFLTGFRFPPTHKTFFILSVAGIWNSFRRHTENKLNKPEHRRKKWTVKCRVTKWIFILQAFSSRNVELDISVFPKVFLSSIFKKKCSEEKYHLQNHSHYQIMDDPLYLMMISHVYADGRKYIFRKCVFYNL